MPIIAIILRAEVPSTRVVKRTLFHKRILLLVGFATCCYKLSTYAQISIIRAAVLAHYLTIELLLTLRVSRHQKRRMILRDRSRRSSVISMHEARDKEAGGAI